MQTLAQPEMLFTATDGCSAEFSPDRVYRYTLTRQWDDGKCIAWLMFNPSSATAESDDPTIRKCIGFSRRWGYGRLVIVNLYAVRSSDPSRVKRLTDPVGPLNNYWITKAVSEAREVVCAWGCAQHLSTINSRIHEAINLIVPDDCPLICLGYRKDGHPRHPLMVSYDTPRQPFTLANEFSGRRHEEEL